MRELKLKLEQKHFNLIWKSLHARENDLLQRVKQFGDDSEEGAFALNDLVYLRLYKKELQIDAEKIFYKNAFNISDEAYEPGA